MIGAWSAVWPLGEQSSVFASFTFQGVILAVSKLALCGSAMEGIQLVLLCEQAGLAMLRAATVVYTHGRRLGFLRYTAMAVLLFAAYLGLLLWECFHEPCDYIAMKATRNSTLFQDILDKSLFGIGMLWVALAHHMESWYMRHSLSQVGPDIAVTDCRKVAQRRITATLGALLLLLAVPSRQFRSPGLLRVADAAQLESQRLESMKPTWVLGLRLVVLVIADWCLAYMPAEAIGASPTRHQVMTPVLFAAAVLIVPVFLNLGLPDADASACCYDRRLYLVTVPCAAVLSWLMKRLQDAADDHGKRFPSVQDEHWRDRYHESVPIPLSTGNRCFDAFSELGSATRSAEHPDRESEWCQRGFWGTSEREQHLFKRSLWRHGVALWKHIQQNSEAHKILSVLVLNLSYAGIEFLFGFWSHSLGLVSDSAHMLLDASALFIGLLASYWASLSPNMTFTFGFQRVEVLAGFTNALTLSFVAITIWTEALSRFIQPVTIETQTLLPVSCVGLVVNLIGLWLLRHRHIHLGESSCAHEHNMGAIYLHVLADALGSVGVIVSSLLIQFLDLQWSDPLCSILIASLILFTTVPFLKRCYDLLAGIYTEMRSTHLYEAFENSELVGKTCRIQALRVWYVTWDTPVVTAKLQVTGDSNPLQLRETFQLLVKRMLGRRAQAVVEIDLLDRIQHLNESRTERSLRAAASDEIQQLKRA
ncbi:hypothetical protein F1559_002176 [Cyanidiococcus yangmingshanensis]|uniref:Cation efflux protein transmembrane domain-containing protein n=1 Tax=Cyanidiococcus yangmingshanensis TaxID=2690220 RepID=A0A7J7IFC9_9RHOD|nr:hypothetical protein F1559_002176 [Cyanidiococcus yangmingshanensis]